MLEVSLRIWKEWGLGGVSICATSMNVQKSKGILQIRLIKEALLSKVA